MALGTLRSIQVTGEVDGVFHKLDWRFGQTPHVMARNDQPDELGECSPTATGWPLVTKLAERIVAAAADVLKKTPLEIVSIEYRLKTGTITAGAYWTTYGVTDRVELKPETIARIAAAMNG